MPFAHVGGMPVEEALLPLAGGGSATLLLARAWLGSHLRRIPELERLCRRRTPGKADAT